MQIDRHTFTQDGHPHVVTRWPPQDGRQGRGVVGDQASRGGHLGVARQAGGAVRSDKACRGGQLGGASPAQEGSWGRSGWQGNS